MSPARRCAVAVTLLVLLSPKLLIAAEYPEVVRRFLDNAQKLCLEQGGRPGLPENAVNALDIDDNGKPDWLIDYGKMTCDGAPQTFCAGGFCTIDALTWRSGNVWRLMLHASVARWRVGTTRGKHAFLLLQRSEICGKSAERHCTVIYTFDKGKMQGRIASARQFDKMK